MPASKELAKQGDGSIAIVGANLDQIEHALSTGEEIKLDLVDPEEAAQAIVMRILTAETDEQAFSRKGTVGGRELVGVPLEIHPPLRAFPSQFRDDPDNEGGLSFFIVFEAIRLDSGERVAISTGSRGVLAALVNGIRRERFPELKLMFQELEGMTSRGRKPLSLVKVQ